MRKTTKHGLSCAAVMLALSCGQLHARAAEGMGGAYAACRAPVDMHMTAASDNTRLVSRRPKMEDRLFVSDAVEKKIKEVRQLIKDNAYLAWMFENCFPNTLDTTVHYTDGGDGKEDTFVYTGDIHAMWLRDSGAQVWPYVQYANKDKKLKKMLRGVILRQLKCINIDPYANAFNPVPLYEGNTWEADITDMKPELHERQSELDSVCHPIRVDYR